MKYGFELFDKRNGCKTIAMVPMVTSEVIEKAMELHNIFSWQIGIGIMRLEDLEDATR